MFTRHRIGPTNELDCPHAMGTNAFSPQRGRVISSLSAATIAVGCLRPTKAEESSTQPWSGYGAASGFKVYGYIVMPEHVHLLLSEPQRDTSSDGTAPLKPKDGLNGPPVLSEQQRDTLAEELNSLKQGVSRRVIGDAEHFWQKRYYDFNIRNYPQFVEKLRYIHRNPVRAGLCRRWEDLVEPSNSPPQHKASLHG